MYEWHQEIVIDKDLQHRRIQLSLGDFVDDVRVTNGRFVSLLRRIDRILIFKVYYFPSHLAFVMVSMFLPQMSSKYQGDFLSTFRVINIQPINATIVQRYKILPLEFNAQMLECMGKIFIINFILICFYSCFYFLRCIPPRSISKVSGECSYSFFDTQACCNSHKLHKF